MRRALSEQKVKKTNNQYINGSIETNRETKSDANNFLILRNNLKAGQHNLKGNVTKLNIDAQSNSKSGCSTNVLGAYVSFSKNSKLNNLNSNRIHTEVITRNNSVDRIKHSNIQTNANFNNNKNYKSQAFTNKVIKDLKSTKIRNTTNNLENEALRNIHYKPRIMDKEKHGNIRSININANKAEYIREKFSNIDPSIDRKYNKPSEKFQRVKYSDPFSTSKKHKTNFGYVYSAGGIPCRIEHGSVKMKLKWDIEPERNLHA